jgi:hypothetical protein
MSNNTEAIKEEQMAEETMLEFNQQMLIQHA